MSHRFAVPLTLLLFATAVTAGENRGEKLANDHVAREWRLTPGASATTRFALPADVPVARLSLVAWVQEADAPAPLQAVSLSLGQCRG